MVVVVVVLVVVVVAAVVVMVVVVVVVLDVCVTGRGYLNGRPRLHVTTTRYLLLRSVKTASTALTVTAGIITRRMTATSFANNFSMVMMSMPFCVATESSQVLGIS